ncbi:hypothetical protein J4418_04110 [Candidatus Woesearchaeota archaeon]|nr:hypothetical protein [Candidatus Woesearchaeota archaeon]
MNKKGFVWYLFQQEMIFMWIGLIIGLVLAFLMVYDVIPVSQWFTICPTG